MLITGARAACHYGPHQNMTHRIAIPPGSDHLFTAHITHSGRVTRCPDLRVIVPHFNDFSCVHECDLQAQNVSHCDAF